jgi:hypothetical protein
MNDIATKYSVSLDEFDKLCFIDPPITYGQRVFYPFHGVSAIVTSRRRFLYLYTTQGASWPLCRLGHRPLPIEHGTAWSSNFNDDEDTHIAWNTFADTSAPSYRGWSNWLIQQAVAQGVIEVADIPKWQKAMIKTFVHEEDGLQEVQDNITSTALSTASRVSSSTSTLSQDRLRDMKLSLTRPGVSPTPRSPSPGSLSLGICRSLGQGVPEGRSPSKGSRK